MQQHTTAYWSVVIEGWDIMVERNGTHTKFRYHKNSQILTLSAKDPASTFVADAGQGAEIIDNQEVGAWLLQFGCKVLPADVITALQTKTVQVPPVWPGARPKSLLN